MNRAEFSFEAYTPSGYLVEGSIVIEFEHELDEEMTAAQVLDMADRIFDGDWTSRTTISPK